MFPSRRSFRGLARGGNFPNCGFLPSSHLVRLPGGFRLRGWVVLGPFLSAGRKIMGYRNARGRGRSLVFALVLLSLLASVASAQGPAPETAPPLFPGGGLISYNSIFTTRGLISNLPGNIPLTARPTFSHEGDFHFTWGFRRDFDLTVLVPVITNHFEIAKPIRMPMSGGTGLGDAMVLVKYRFYRRDSKRGTTQASVTLGPKVPTGPNQSS